MAQRNRTIPDDVRERLELAMPWRKNLRDALKARDISLAEASRKCGFNHEYMSRVNAGLNPTIDRLLFIFEQCEIPVSEIFGGTAMTSAVDEIVKEVSAMNDDELALATRLLASIK